MLLRILLMLQLEVSMEEQFSWIEWEVWGELSSWNDELAYAFLFRGLCGYCFYGS